MRRLVINNFLAIIKLIKLIKPYWFNKKNKLSILSFLFFISCIGFEILASVGYNRFHKDFFNALQAFNYQQIYHSLLFFLAVITLYASSMAGAFYFQNKIVLHWRNWLTRYYLSHWAKHGAIHIENPDQRISEDLAKLPQLTLFFVQKILHSLLTLIMFSIILWQLSKTIDLPFFNVSIHGGYWWASLTYACLGTFVIQYLGKHLSSLDYEQQLTGANFRLALVHSKTNSHSKLSYAQQTYRHVKKNVKQTYKLQTKLLLFAKSYNFLAYFIGLLLAVPLYLNHEILLGIVMQISSAFNTVNSAFSVLIDSFNEFAEWRAVARRVFELSSR